MSHDRRNDDDAADWLLAQLAAGPSRPRVEPPIVPPPTDAAPTSPEPTVVPRPVEPGPRSEEVLDWFSLAEPSSATDAATRALPVIGDPPAAAPAPTSVEPSTAGLPLAPATPPAAPFPPVAEPTSGLPAWSPPFTVGGAPAAPSATSAFGAAATPSAEPVEPPPGPVTPTGPFAFTWGGGDLDSEDAIRAAFRSLSDPTPIPPAPIPPAAAAPVPPASPAPASQVPAPQLPEPQAPASAEAESPFAGYPSPPVARQSFTPAPGLAPAAEEPSATPRVEPTVTPRHPITPSTAPAGWDELAAHADPEPTPPTASSPPAASGGRFGAFASDTFGAEAADPFRALIDGSPRAGEPEPPLAAAFPAPEPTAAPAPASFSPSIPNENTTPRGFPFLEVRGEADEPVVEPVGLQADVAANRRAPFPAFASASGDHPGQDSQPDEPVDDLLAALGSGTARPSRSDQPSSFAEPTDRDAGAGAPPERGGPPTGDDGAFGALGFSFDDGDEEDEVVDDPREGRPAKSGIRGRLFGRGRAPADDADAPEVAAADAVAEPTAVLPSVPATPSATPLPTTPETPATPPASAFDAAEPARPESPIARELAETGYFWNLTPDPEAADPKADAPAVPERPTAFDEDWPEPEPASFAPAVTQPDWFDDRPDLSVEEPDRRADDADDLGVLPQPAQPIDAEPVEAQPIDQPGRPTFTASLFLPPTEAEPEPDVDAQPSWSFADDSPAVPDRHTGSAADAPTAMFPPASAGAASPDDDDDPLAALFGTKPARPSPPLQDPFSTGSPLGDAAGTSAPADRVAADAGPFAAFAAPAAAAAATTPAPTTPAPPTTRPGAPRTGGSGGTRGSGSGSGGAGGPGGRSDGGNRTVRILAWVAGGLVAALVLVGLFFLGTQLSGGGGQAAEPVTTPTQTEEAPVAAPTAPQPPGVHAWNTLFGGECLDPFESAWAEEFTVVDCAAPHAAQLVYRGTLPGEEGSPFPGEAEIASQMNLLCTAPGIIDVAAVSGIEDLQVQAAFPVTEEQWADGERTYYCFANRAGGEPLTAGIAGPGPAA